MDDLVNRLRAVSEFGGTHLDGLWTEAADCIEALEKQIGGYQHNLTEMEKALRLWLHYDKSGDTDMLQMMLEYNDALEATYAVLGEEKDASA